MRTLKTSVIAALLVPAFAVSAFAFDHHEGDGQDKMKEKKAAHMAKMKEKCAKAEDMEKCMADMKAKKKMKMKKKMEKKEEAKPE